MTRDEKVLHSINKHEIGVEIGPSFRPLAAKRNGFRVHTIDHLNKEELRSKYKDHNVDIESIEEVDFIWKGQSYVELTQRPKYYSWIIASHLIEHTPDLISFINQCDEILRNDGVLSLVIPDSSYCFDFFRPLTGVSKVIDAYHNKHTIHTPGTVAEYFLNFSKRNNTICWGEGSNEDFSLEFNLHDANEKMQVVLQQKVYLDVHAWCFTPTSFRLLIQDLNDLGFISLKEVSFFPSVSCEFYITLGRSGNGFTQNRLDTLKQIKSEVGRGVNF